MRVLITGGAGFIGSHLSEHLLDWGARVSILDDLSTGAMENIVHLKSNPRFEYTIDSIMNTRLTAELVDRSDLVFHLAAAVGVRIDRRQPGSYHRNQHTGHGDHPRTRLQKEKACIDHFNLRVYGKSSKVPFSEADDLVLGPTYKARWSYACSKAIDEFLALAYWREKGCRSYRASVQHGWTEADRAVRHGASDLSWQALAGSPITVFGDGRQCRCFCHVADVVSALTRPWRRTKGR
jgi:UDP-glucose 4-epimerase